MFDHVHLQIKTRYISFLRNFSKVFAISSILRNYQRNIQSIQKKSYKISKDNIEINFMHYIILIQ